jgi:hypothetical protein
MKTQKFQADTSHGIRGFWTPTEKGEAIEGYILDVMENEYGKSLVIQLSEGATVITKDRDTGDKVERDADAGQAIGCTVWAGLRGLDRRKDYFVRIVFLGEKKEKGQNGEMIRTKAFDVDLSETPIPVQERKGVAKAGRRATASA